MLADHVQGERVYQKTTGALLAGKVLGPDGDPLTTAHTSKPGKTGRPMRYRYYVSQTMHHNGGQGGIRVPAREIEGAVTTRVAALFADPLTLPGKLQLDIDPARMAAATQACGELAISLAGSRKRDLVHLVAQVRVGERDLEIDIDVPVLARMLAIPLHEDMPPILTLTEPVRLTRTGKVFRLLDSQGCAAATQLPDEPLLRMLGQARTWWATLAEGRLNVEQLAARENVNPSRLTRILRMAFLSLLSFTEK